MKPYRKPQWVKAGDHGWVDIDSTAFADIEEGLHGDEYTFIYEGEEYTSQIISGSQPG